MTYEEIRDEIADEVGDDSDEMKTIVFTGLREAMGEIYSRVRGRYQQVRRYRNFIVGQENYELPDDWIRGLAVYYIDANSRVLLIQALTPDYLETYGTDTSGDPDVYRIFGNEICFQNIPNTTRTIKIEYWATAETPVLADECPLPQRFVRVLKWGAKRNVADFNEEDMSKSIAMFEKGLADMESEMWSADYPSEVRSAGDDII